jgi:hypothetical protein
MKQLKQRSHDEANGRLERKKKSKKVIKINDDIICGPSRTVIDLGANNFVQGRNRQKNLNEIANIMAKKITQR